jgi:hypothetical protein
MSVDSRFLATFEIINVINCTFMLATGFKEGPRGIYWVKYFENLTEIFELYEFFENSF